MILQKPFHYLCVHQNLYRCPEESVIRTVIQPAYGPSLPPILEFRDATAHNHWVRRTIEVHCGLDVIIEVIFPGNRYALRHGLFHNCCELQCSLAMFGHLDNRWASGSTICQKGGARGFRCGMNVTTLDVLLLDAAQITLDFEFIPASLNPKGSGSSSSSNAAVRNKSERTPPRGL